MKEMMQMFALVGAICLWAPTGVAGKVETAVFVVEGKEVPVGELTVAWEAGSFMYDSTGKTPEVTAKGIARGTLNCFHCVRFSSARAVCF